MKKNLQQFAVFAVAAFILALPLGVRADAVTDWNAIAVNATLGCPAAPPCPAPPPFAARPGPSAVLDFAVVHGAIYDAVQAIERDYQPYCGDIPGASGRTDAAVAKAAHDVLVNRFPAQTGALDLIYDNYLVAHGILTTDLGIPVGAASAGCMIALRANDGSFPPVFTPFRGYDQIGFWYSPPPLPAMATPWLGAVTPFTMRSSSQFRPKPPPRLTSPEYTRNYNEVKSMGSLTGSGRTPDQTDLANFWNLGYPTVWQRAVRDISTANVTNISDSSRLFALATMSGADAVITAWDSKITYVFWRPSMAIQQGDLDGNPNTIGDPAWTPLVANPPYPDYTSGANNISAATTRALSLFFGTDDMTFTVKKSDTITRTFNRFSDVRDEVVDARIWEGIHFRFADEKARKQGEHIAQWAHGHFFRPRGNVVE